jgi:hypothetical protein
MFAVYFIALLLAGAALIALGASHKLGTWSYYLGGFLALAGGISLPAMLKTGGAGLAECPACRSRFDVLHIATRRVMPCPSCHRWIEGAAAMAVVPGDRVEPKPEFAAPWSESTRWPTICTVCLRPATRTVKVEGSDVGIRNLVAPVSTFRITTIGVPACDHHDGGASLFPSGPVPAVKFRSFAYWESYCAANQITPAAANAAHRNLSQLTGAT